MPVTVGGDEQARLAGAEVGHLRGRDHRATAGNPMPFDRRRDLSCPDAIGKAIDKYTRTPSRVILDDEAEETDIDMPVDQTAAVGNGCPDCGAKIEREGGCIVCRICGFSKCS